MRVAIVHDSIGEFGGAERVVLALSEIWPDAPIYTSFVREGPFLERLRGKRICVSWASLIPFFSTKLHSPLRFLAPLIWGSFDFSKYDVVISSASWYVTKGFKRGEKTLEVCYCHTPPRWLYGYQTPLDVRKNWMVRAYVSFLAHFMRMYDWEAAQRVDYFVANSKNVKERILKFYKREAEVVYPPISIPEKFKAKKSDYYLIVSRVTGGKGIEMAVEAANRLKIKLKIAGLPSGYSETYEWVKANAGPTVELLGFVDDKERSKLYAEAKAFLALQKDEDFGMTLPEAMSHGTPVIAYRGGGYPESVIDGKTGILFKEYSVDGLVDAIERFKKRKFSAEACRRQGEKFSEDNFKRKMKRFVEDQYRDFLKR